jgi:meso-butanediol dehydrogenase / (S,S)-butanediol dehydrogenase / diacetyl reductase
MAERLRGKVAFITGASSGIGAATAARFAAEGATVVVCARRADKLSSVIVAIERAGGRASAQACDIGDFDAYVRALDATAQRHGRLDVLVNNAMYTGMGLLADQPLADWQQNFRINADAVFVSMQAAFRLMPKNGGGSIVNISSICGIRAIAYTAAYSASKAAMIQLSAVAAIEGAPLGIRVNTVIPGGVDTEATRDSYGGNEAWARAAAAAVPAGRFGRPDELANAILFLASDESSYVTGACLSVDGGKAVQLHVPGPPAETT